MVRESKSQSVITEEIVDKAPPYEMRIRVNGTWHDFEVGRDIQAADTLAYVLRDKLGLTGLKVACASAGFNRGNPFSGYSAIIDPRGIRLASAGLYESVPKADIDISEIYKIRGMLTLHKDRVFEA